MTGVAVGVLAFTNSDTGYTLAGVKFVKHFRWVGATTSGHRCVLKAAGATVFESIADGAQFIDVHPMYRFLNNLVIDTLESGTLYAYMA